ncbi:carboxymuconolactone decarboxylase family protein [Pseudoalteromonas sp. SR44-5]|uniref:carboxymuconolactone decarboxylase family protein n=1 Tax=unclassified Pseudoalteromonas TaxID=194690 RepID=UPI0016032C11|nr:MULTISPECIES: carboxymuconolactone decarboxylase family protein [unclassified Pseudoalteromonas]MBB1366419.1 carboxymuconolactone decarboxylase family protein [Pseudoalteromonas sp. SR44-5]MBB1417289.1 carboxymuconolactone decarboxylase family protein [Pseudoalteromonas sp. SG44-1]MBB1421111.1 carboxymuconolactone decarboxylase family protein [Pseudoalteromonas sp. SG43-7]MBB1480991.1 carboxymuconolactone decarboxylase family protein [Pseudoalteromonas sp. SG41-2]
MKRANYFNIEPELMTYLIDQEVLIKQKVEATFGVTIWELLKLRASQLNQCAYCLAMHSKQALEYGESINRIIALNAWQDTPLYNDKERAALALCEKLTLSQNIDDDFYQTLSALFDQSSLVTLTVAINAINSWNRMVKMFKPTVEFNER